ncbi:MAG TPA: thioesterase family protein [Bacteroidia bacterium]|nr:thioesterase family protein [Bacteroidia bacterium]
MKKEDINLNLFQHKIPIQIRYIDIDMQQHVNNAVYLSYIEQGRVEYMNKLFPENDFQKNGLIIARTEIDYYEPIFLNEEIYCYTRISKIGTKSFVFENVLSSNAAIKCFAQSIMVCFDYTQNTTIPVPDEWKKKIIEFEKLIF